MTIKIDPDVLHGAPHIEGTRIGVSHILQAVSTQAMQQIARQYPELSLTQISEALDYARKVMENIPQIRDFNSVLTDTWDNKEDAAYDEY